MGKVNNPGIDYSRGQSNVDNNNIHYGVIPSNEVGQYWYEESEGFYIPFCPECYYEFKKSKNPVKCPACQYKPIDESDFFTEEPISFLYKKEGYLAEQTYDDPDIFIIKSPYFTYAQYCSPCAPGAGYILNYTDENIGAKTYCFGHDWFENEKAPYPVYSVKTGKRILG